MHPSQGSLHIVIDHILALKNSPFNIRAGTKAISRGRSKSTEVRISQLIPYRISFEAAELILGFPLARFLGAAKFDAGNVTRIFCG